MQSLKLPQTQSEVSILRGVPWVQTLDCLEDNLQWRVLHASQSSLVALLATLPARLHALAVRAKTDPNECFYDGVYWRPACETEQQLLEPGQYNTLLLCKEKDTHASALANVLPALLRQTHSCTALTGMTLYSCAVSTAASHLVAQLLADLPQMRQLRIEGCHIGDDAARVLIRSALTALSDLRELSFRDNSITMLAAQAFSLTPACRKLEVLDLGLNNIGYAGYHAVVALSIQLPELRVLDLTNCNLVLSEDLHEDASHLPPLHLCASLRALALCAADEATLQLLLHSLKPLMPQLARLRVRVITHLPEDTTSFWPCLTEATSLLHLGVNVRTCPQRIEIGEALVLPALTRLSLTTADYDEAALVALLLAAPNLREVSILATEVEGPQRQLAAVLPKLHLTSLDIALSAPDKSCADVAAVLTAVKALTSLRNLKMGFDRELECLPALLAALPQLTQLQLAAQTACESAGQESVLRGAAVQAVLHASRKLHALVVQASLADVATARLPAMPHLTSLILNDFSGGFQDFPEHGQPARAWVAPVPTLAAILHAAPALQALQLARVRVPSACTRQLWAAIGSLTALTTLALMIGPARVSISPSWYAEQARALRQLTGLKQLAVQHGTLDMCDSSEHGKGDDLDAALRALRASILQLRGLQALCWPLVREQDIDSFIVPLAEGLPRLVHLDVSMMYAIQEDGPLQLGMWQVGAPDPDWVPAELQSLHAAACTSGILVDVIGCEGYGEQYPVAPQRTIHKLLTWDDWDAW